MAFWGVFENIFSLICRNRDRIFSLLEAADAIRSMAGLTKERPAAFFSPG